MPTPEQEQALLDQTAARIRALTETAYADLIQRIQNGEAPRDAIAAVTAGFAGEYYAELSVAFSAMLAKTIGVAEIKTWPVGEVALSERLYAHTREVNAATERLIRNHREGFVQARTLALQIYEGYEFQVDPLQVKARLPKYLRLALRDPAISQGYSQILARIRANQLKTPALRAAYLQAIDALEAGAGAERLQKMARIAWYERNRYFANRIAQTELHRAYEDQKAIEMMDDPELAWVQIKLSPTHPKTDVCFRAGTMVMTSCGEKPIESLAVNDSVFTHNGRFQKVKRLHRSKVQPGEKLTLLTTESSQYREVILTPGHPVLTTSGWTPAGDLRTGSICLSVDASCLSSQRERDEADTIPSSSLGNWLKQDQRKTDALLYGVLANSLLIRTLRKLAIHFQAPISLPTIATCIYRKLTNFRLSSLGYYHLILPLIWRREPQQCDGTYLYDEIHSLGSLSHAWFGRPLSNESSLDLAGQSISCMLDRFSFDTARSNTFGLGIESKKTFCTDNTFYQSLQSSSDINQCMIAQTDTILSNGEWVYNLEVDKDNSYVANGLIVHNCDYHARLDRYGQGPGVYPKAEAPKPPFHPHCLSGDTLITASGRVAAVSKRWFYGYVVIITTTTGKHITATVNHPILTRSGWVAAGALDLGDDVVCRVAADGVGADVIINDQHQDVPTSIAEIADAFFGSSQVTPTEVPVSAEDFHGDGMAGQIAVIGTDSKLGDWSDTGLLEHIQDGCLSVTRPAHGRLFGDGVPHFGSEAFRASSDGIVSLRSQSRPLARAESGHSDNQGLAAVSDGDAISVEVINDCLSADAESIRDGKARFTGGIGGNEFDADIGANDAPIHTGNGARFGMAPEAETTIQKAPSNGFGADTVLAAQIIEGQTGAVVFEAVINIERRLWGGHVYNLDTEYGHYTSNGIVTHNCRCRAVPRYDIDSDAQQVYRHGAHITLMQSLSDYDQRLVAGSRGRLKRFRDGESIESIYDRATRKEYRLKRLGDIKPPPQT